MKSLQHTTFIIKIKDVFPEGTLDIENKISNGLNMFFPYLIHWEVDFLRNLAKYDEYIISLYLNSTILIYKPHLIHDYCYGKLC